MWGVFRKTFTNGAKGIIQWYRLSVGKTLKELGRPLLLMMILSLSGIAIGFILMRIFPLPLQNLSNADWKEQVQSSLALWPLFASQNFIAFLSNNFRFMLLSLILGLLSLGILGVLPTIATVAVTTYLLGTLGANGLPAGLIFLGFILPHGWLEIGAGILASSVILKGQAPGLLQQLRRKL